MEIFFIETCIELTKFIFHKGFLQQAFKIQSKCIFFIVRLSFRVECLETSRVF